MVVPSPRASESENLTRLYPGSKTKNNIRPLCMGKELDVQAARNIDLFFKRLFEILFCNLM